MRDIWLKPRNPTIIWGRRTPGARWVMCLALPLSERLFHFLVSLDFLLAEKLFHFLVSLNFRIPLDVQFHYHLCSQSKKRLVDICSIFCRGLNEWNPHALREFLPSTSQVMNFYLCKCITDLSLVEFIRLVAHDDSACTLRSMKIQKFKPALEVVKRPL